MKQLEFNEDIERRIKKLEDKILNKILNKNISLSKKNKKVIFKNFQSPGDILMLTAAVRELKLS